MSNLTSYAGLSPLESIENERWTVPCLFRNTLIDQWYVFVFLRLFEAVRMVGITEMYAKLKPLPPDLKADLQSEGIRITNMISTVVYDAESVEFKTIVEKLLASPLADDSVMIKCHYNPVGKEKKLWKLNRNQGPFPELSAEMCRGIDSEFQGHSDAPLNHVNHLFTPARIAIPKIIKTFSNPDPKRCPVTFAFPSGTYLSTIEFHFYTWTFAARVYRE